MEKYKDVVCDCFQCSRYTVPQIQGISLALLLVSVQRSCVSFMMRLWDKSFAIVVGICPLEGRVFANITMPLSLGGMRFCVEDINWKSTPSR